MAEFDSPFELSVRNEITSESIVEYQPPPGAKYYLTPGNVPDVEIIPIENIILDDNVKIILNKLAKTFESKNYDPKTYSFERSQSLDLNLRELLNSFRSNLPINPVETRTAVVINKPSPSFPTQPSVVGLGAPLIDEYPISTDFLYNIIDGSDRVALSLYFNYDNIPIVTRV